MFNALPITAHVGPDRKSAVKRRAAQPERKTTRQMEEEPGGTEELAEEESFKRIAVSSGMNIVGSIDLCFLPPQSALNLG